MELGLKDQVVIITGAGSGMGRAGAIVFAEQGARVVVSDTSGRNDEVPIDLSHSPR